MSHSSKRTLSLALVVMLLICLLPTVVSASGDVELIDSPISVASGWQCVTQINTANWGGTFNPTSITEGSSLTLNFTGENFWSAHLAIAGSVTGWAQKDCEASTFEKHGEGSDAYYTLTFTYDDIVSLYGSDDLSGINAFYIYTNTDSGSGATVNSLTFTPAGSSEATTEPETGDVYTPTGGIVLDSASHEQSNAWSQITVVETTLAGGTIDPATFAKDGYVAITYTGTKGAIYLATQDATSWGWGQVDEPSSTTVNPDGSFTSVFTREAIAAVYPGADGFTDLAKLIIGTANITEKVVVRDIRWYAESESGEEETTAPTTEETTEATTEAPSEETTVAPGDETTEAPTEGSTGAPEGGILLDGNSHEQPNKWTIITELSTTNADGTLDPSIFAGDGYLAITYTGTKGALYVALMDATAWQWVQTDVADSTTTNADGSFTSIYKRSTLASIYKGKSNFSDLGKLILGTGETTGNTVITDIRWFKTEQTKKTYNAKLGYAAAGDWEPNEWGDNANTTVTGGGTYSIHYTPSEAADGAEVFVVDIIGGAELYRTCKLVGVSVTADGVNIPVNLNKVRFGDLEYNGNLRIEIFNAFGSNDPSIDLSALNFSQELIVSFTLEEVAVDDSNPNGGDSFRFVAFGTLLISAMAIVALTVSRKKWLA